MSERISRTFLNRSGRRNKHHILAKKRGGVKKPDNLILLDENRHAAFHLVFKNRTFLEAAKVLVRTHNFKNGTNYVIEGG